MKTALISTEFWESDDIASLNSDTRSVYLCLLTNPKRNTTPVFKLSNRLLSFYSGYNLDVVKTCISQLESKGFIAFVDGYYILLGQEYVKAKRGKLTQSIEEKYLESLPESVLELLDLKDNSSRTSLEQPLEYNNKDNNKDKHIDIYKHNNEDIRLAELLKEKVDTNFPNRKVIKIDSWYDEFRKLRELDKFTVSEIETVIYWVHGGEFLGNKFNEHDFWSVNIRSAGKLRKQMDTLVARMQQDYKKSNGIINTNKTEII